MRLEQLDHVREQRLGRHAAVAVDDGDEASSRGAGAQRARRRAEAVGVVEEADAGIARRDGADALTGVVGAATVDHQHFEGEGAERLPEDVAEDGVDVRALVAHRHDDAHVGRTSAPVGRHFARLRRRARSMGRCGGLHRFLGFVVWLRVRRTRHGA